MAQGPTLAFAVIFSWGCCYFHNAMSLNINVVFLTIGYSKLQEREWELFRGLTLQSDMRKKAQLVGSGITPRPSQTIWWFMLQE